MYVRKGDELERYIFNTTTLSCIDELGTIDLMIDIGAGEGRYSQYFGTKAKHVIAIEPDVYRCDKTKECTQSMSARVTCEQGTVKDLNVNDGEVVKDMIGVMPKESYLEAIESLA